MNMWRAKFRNIGFPGGWVMGGGMQPVGTMTLRLELEDAGIHTRREVAFEIEPGQLDRLATMVAGAIAARDKAAR